MDPNSLIACKGARARGVTTGDRRQVKLDKLTFVAASPLDSSLTISLAMGFFVTVLQSAIASSTQRVSGIRKITYCRREVSMSVLLTVALLEDLLATRRELLEIGYVANELLAVAAGLSQERTRRRSRKLQESLNIKKSQQGTHDGPCRTAGSFGRFLLPAGTHNAQRTVSHLL